MLELSIKRGRGRPLGQSEDLTEEELDQILKTPDRRSKRGLRDYTILLTFANTPMRKSELCALDLGNLLDEGKKKSISYKALKKRKRRDPVTGEVQVKQKPYWLKIPLDIEVFRAIVRYVESEHKGKKLERTTPLFNTMGTRGPYQKRRITPKAIDGIVSRYVQAAGIRKRVTPHSFRASYVTIRLGLGHDPVTLQKTGGWADIRGVMPYLRSNQKKIEEAALSRRFL